VGGFIVKPISAGLFVTFCEQSSTFWCLIDVIIDLDVFLHNIKCICAGH